MGRPPSGFQIDLLRQLPIRRGMKQGRDTIITGIPGSSAMGFADKSVPRRALVGNSGDFALGTSHSRKRGYGGQDANKCSFHEAMQFRHHEGMNPRENPAADSNADRSAG